MQGEAMSCKEELTKLRREVADLKEQAMKREDKLLKLRGEVVELKKQAALRQKVKWNDLPVELQDDRDFVIAAICCREGLDWHYMPTKWKEDIGVVKAVMKAQEGRRLFRKHLCVKWQDLPISCQTNLEVVVLALRSDKGGPSWREVPVWFKGDPDVVLAALQTRRLDWNDVPSELQRSNRDIALIGVQERRIHADDCPCLDREFLKEAVESAQIDWDLLPTELRDDIDYARGFSRFTNARNPRIILDHFPVLRHDQAFWRKMLDSVSDSWFCSPFRDDNAEDYGLFELLRDYASPEILSDGDLMKRECCRNAPVFRLVHLTLASDHDFLAAVLEKEPFVLRFLPHETQLMYPHLVASALFSLCSRTDHGRGADGCGIVRAIAPTFFQDRGFVLNVWAKAGYGIQFLPEDVWKPWTDDKQVFLLIAEHNPQDFRHASKSLRKDEDFMLQVVERDPSLIEHTLTNYFELFVTAFAGSPAVAQKKLKELYFKGYGHVIDRFLDGIKEELDLFDAFSSTVLRCMLSTQTVNTSGSNLSLLNQGVETSVVYKKLIAEYVGIPMGKELRLLRGANQNVRDAIAPFWPPIN